MSIKKTKSKVFDQLCILLLDGSGSMKELMPDGVTTKGQEVGKAVNGLIKTLKKSSKAPGYSVAVINYSSTPELALTPIVVTEIIPDNHNFDPTINMGYRTHLAPALTMANELIQEHFDVKTSSTVHKSAVILLMSDGFNEDMNEALPIAESIKSFGIEKVRVATSLFRSAKYPAHYEQVKAQLQSLSSVDKDGSLFFEETNAATQQRKFFERSSSFY